MREYFLKLLSDALVCGHNPAQKFIIMKGAKGCEREEHVEKAVAAVFFFCLFKDLAVGVNVRLRISNDAE